MPAAKTACPDRLPHRVAGKRRGGVRAAALLFLAAVPVSGRAGGIHLDRDDPANAAIVRIVTYQSVAGGIVRVTGTGFFVNRQGQLITNRHLLSRALFSAALGPGCEPFRVDRVLAEAGDLVMVQIALPSGIRPPCLELRKEPPVPGEPIRIEGYPLGVGLASAWGKVVGYRQKPYYGTRSFEVDAPTFSGNSGGPIVDERGQVVGVTTFRSQEGSSRLAGALCPHVLMEESRVIDLPFAVWSRRSGGADGAIGSAARGWRALQSGESEPACRYFQAALRKRGRSPLLHQGLAEALLESGRVGEAASSLCAAIKERPNDFLAHLRLAAVYRRLGKPELAAVQEAAGRRLEGAIFARIQTAVAAREQTGLAGLWQKVRYILQPPVESEPSH
ncbi:serine protease [Methylacidimicrobium sp. AP8]|uniref:S1 family peptidase n=1 Tax=Methylacidimicrobium sp. AP8 TaxID=2730359 RepID=UPI0019238106|nr:serine protease [Methylacidimicrobium sp. AP8]